MAHPKIGIFSALVAVGGALAWQWAQKRRGSQKRLVQDLNRWENEGGAVVALAQKAPLRAGSKRTRIQASNGAKEAGVWRFPHE
jgi:hypothetical protein